MLAYEIYYVYMITLVFVFRNTEGILSTKKGLRHLAPHTSPILGCVKHGHQFMENGSWLKENGPQLKEIIHWSID